MGYSIVIPARYGSTRFPGKPLADINGKPMIQRVYEKCQTTNAEQIVVATDDARIADVVKQFGGQVCMTAATHESGTERIAEVIDKMAIAQDQVIVNVQGDEPFIPAAIVAQVAENLVARPQINMATLAVKIDDVEEAFNPNAVKVLTNKDGLALYFSRATIPYDRSRFLNNDAPQEIGDYYLRHLGIYAYRAGFVKQYVSWQPSALEQIESLEQLRVLWYGEAIHVDIAHETPPPGIDTPQDLVNAINKGYI
ncbi:3-deoxy-manno-octulosonate cytidylyltransferase [Saccharobesus litoralis]|uniref:3-deoxy-manno-octulosonate cytidylyltransferase n=1 Tax=Saccharobesus litoralis TaxID=2172099 RepID=A0A2S0VTD7_9ALTE|nr:3-deoxy-manno-octulosonate cytidylyltransferase [Saccharobesus litoralis]AWB67453.1 3-deoxy-manno-octulosonate cytidylyltransferase [Saccharobesus litoralis]